MSQCVAATRLGAEWGRSEEQTEPAAFLFLFGLEEVDQDTVALGHLSSIKMDKHVYQKTEEWRAFKSGATNNLDKSRYAELKSLQSNFYVCCIWSFTTQSCH